MRPVKQTCSTDAQERAGFEIELSGLLRSRFVPVYEGVWMPDRQGLFAADPVPTSSVH
jgi:hypothetical protein